MTEMRPRERERERENGNVAAATWMISGCVRRVSWGQKLVPGPGGPSAALFYVVVRMNVFRTGLDTEEAILPVLDILGSHQGRAFAFPWPDSRRDWILRGHSSHPAGEEIALSSLDSEHVRIFGTVNRGTKQYRATRR